MISTGIRARLAAWSGSALGQDFQKLWAGLTVSLFGWQLTLIALPLTAVLALRASDTQMGLLQAAGYLPALVLTLAAGVWTDRSRRRPLMIWADLGRAAVIGVIPVAALLGVLRIELMYAVALVIGVLTVVFDTAAFSYLPSLVTRDDLMPANSRFQLSQSFSFLTGPGLGGLLAQVLSAPFAIVANVLCFLGSAAGVISIRHREPEPEPPAAGRTVLGDIMEGIRFVFGNRFLRPLSLEAAWFNFFGQFVATLYVLYAARDLGLAPVLIGITSSSAGIGSILGSVLVGRASDRFGFGRVLVATMFIGCAPYVLIPLAAGPKPIVVTTLILVYVVQGLGISATLVQVISVRQAVTPERLLGRMQGSYRVLTYGVLPLGALTAGLLGGALGTHTALVIGTIGMFLAPMWVVFSPLWQLTQPRDAVGEAAAAAAAEPAARA